MISVQYKGQNDFKIFRIYSGYLPWLRRYERILVRKRWMFTGGFFFFVGSTSTWDIFSKWTDPGNTSVYFSRTLMINYFNVLRFSHSQLVLFVFHILWPSWLFWLSLNLVTKSERSNPVWLVFTTWNVSFCLRAPWTSIGDMSHWRHDIAFVSWPDKASITWQGWFEITLFPFCN